MTSALRAMTAAAMIGCAADPAPAADAAKCDPVGTYDFSRGQFTAEGGQFCVDNAAIRNQTAAAEVYVVAKNADGTFSFAEQGDEDDKNTKYTLDTAKCELSATAPQQMTTVTDMQANYGNATVDQKITVTFTIGQPATATRTYESEVGSAPPVTSVPCKLMGTSTGVKK